MKKIVLLFVLPLISHLIAMEDAPRGTIAVHIPVSPVELILGDQSREAIGFLAQLSKTNTVVMYAKTSCMQRSLRQELADLSDKNGIKLIDDSRPKYEMSLGYSGVHCTIWPRGCGDYHGNAKVLSVLKACVAENQKTQ